MCKVDFSAHCTSAVLDQLCLFCGAGHFPNAVSTTE